MIMYTATYDETEWTYWFGKLGPDIKERAVKKIAKIVESPYKRHLRGGARFFVDEIGQHRIVYRIFEQTLQVKFYFIGTHKEYER